VSQSIRILCVDDEVNVLRALQRLFLDDDYEVIAASSAGEGLEVLRSSPPIQLIISDYRMPGLNGVDFLKEVYRHWPETVRIVLSGYADTAAVVSAINEGHIYRFVPKPWNDDELRVTIGNALERYYLHQKNAQLMESLAATNAELQSLNENLENLVRDRTDQLMLHNRALHHSQNILDSLPMAVIGFDPHGILVQCNRKGRLLLGGETAGLLGCHRREAIPDEVNEFVEKMLCSYGQDTASSRIASEKGVWNVRGIVLKSEEQEGLILIIESGA